MKKLTVNNNRKKNHTNTNNLHLICISLIVIKTVHDILYTLALRVLIGSRIYGNWKNTCRFLDPKEFYHLTASRKTANIDKLSKIIIVFRTNMNYIY